MSIFGKHPSTCVDARCGGPLGFHGTACVCDRCGLAYKGHPMTLEAEAARAREAEAAKARDEAAQSQPVTLEATHNDRINALERKLKSAEGTLLATMARVASLEAAAKGGQKKAG